MPRSRSPVRWSAGTNLRAAWLGLVRRGLWGIRVGTGTRIHPLAYIDRTWPKGVRIGAGCLVDREAVILTHDRARGLYLDTTIGNGTVIGARAIVMPGVTIGADCLVMPGALVLRDMPAGHVALGNPATVSPRPPAAG